MPEISLVKGLSGRETLDSILHELRQKLLLNGRFGTNMSYPGYRAVLRLEFYPAASFVPQVEQTVEVQQGIGAEGVILSETATVDESVEIPVRSPNQVRVESGMKVPVLSQDAQGNSVEKWVDPKDAKGKPPKKLAVKGGNVGPEPAVTMVPTAIVATEAEAAVR